ncbi:MAG: hypothetical protein WD159_01275 [Patescibacteria group bacterium]
MFPNNSGPNFFAGIETQMMASMLHYGIHFLDPLPEEHPAMLARFLVADLREAEASQAWEQAKMDELISGWFNRGRIYETIPADALVSTKELGASATLLFLERIPLKLAEDAIKELRVQTTERIFEKNPSEDGLCRLLWMWFMWGRSYQKGNPPEAHPLPN